MDHRVTQCPRCGTSFRVTDAHLAVAAGAVRCGSCLHIFNAREHWVDAAAEPPPQAEKPAAAESTAEIEIDDDTLFDDDTPLFSDDEAESVKTGSGSIFSPADDDFEVIDDSGIEEFSDTFLEINSWDEDSGDGFGYEVDDDTPEEIASTEHAWTQKLLDENDNEEAADALDIAAHAEPIDDFDGILDTVPEIDETEAYAPGPATAAEFSAEFLNLEADYEAPPREREPAAALTADEELIFESMRAEPRNKERSADHPLSVLRDLEQEPLQLHQFVQESRWPKILWRTGLAAVLLLSAWQYIYFNFNELAHGPLRPWLAQTCSALNCVLPPQFDTALIRTNSLIVRSHPTQRGALAVDAVITNQADFPQPYPQLQLQFSDLNGAPVAGRRFQPSEYLSGELAGSKLMPVRQPIHISLELVDPGPHAVNYLLTVVAAGSGH